MPFIGSHDQEITRIDKAVKRDKSQMGQIT